MWTYLDAGQIPLSNESSILTFGSIFFAYACHWKQFWRILAQDKLSHQRNLIRLLPWDEVAIVNASVLDVSQVVLICCVELLLDAAHICAWDSLPGSCAVLEG